MRTSSWWKVVGPVCLVAGAAGVRAQDIPAADRTALLTSAKSQYYNMRAAGLKSFSCDVQMDWAGLFASAAGQTPKTDDPLMKYLHGLKLTLHNDLLTGPSVTWAAGGEPPAGQAANMQQMRDGFRQMVEGFLTAWTPTWNGTLIPSSPSAMAKTSTGFTINEENATEKDLLVLDKDMKVTHVRSKMETLTAEMDTTFTASPKGLVLTKMDIVSHQPPEAPATQSTMSTTYEANGIFLLPATLAIEVANVVSVKMSFSSCTVERNGVPE